MLNTPGAPDGSHSVDLVSNTTKTIIRTATILFTLLSVILILLDGFFYPNTTRLINYTNTWALLAGLFFLLTLLSSLAVISSPQRSIKTSYLYLFSILCSVAVFCTINSSGGLTGSPFLVLYSTLFTVGIIISDKLSTVIFISFLIIASISLHNFIDGSHFSEPGVDYVVQYNWKYFSVVAINFIVMGTAEAVYIQQTKGFKSSAKKSERKDAK